MRVNEQSAYTIPLEEVKVYLKAFSIEYNEKPKQKKRNKIETA